MKKRITRFALLSVLPVMAAFAVVFNASAVPLGECPPEDPWDRIIIFPDSEDCQLFYYCHMGVPVPMLCPDGLLYDRRLEVCDWAWVVDCEVVANPSHMTQKHVQCEYYGQVYVPGVGYVYGTVSYSVTANVCQAGYENCEIDTNPCGQGTLVE